MRSISARSSGVGIGEITADDHEVGPPAQAGVNRERLDEARHPLHVRQPAHADHERKAAPAGPERLDGGAKDVNHRRRDGGGARDLPTGFAHRLRIDSFRDDVIASGIRRDVDPQEAADPYGQVGPREQGDLTGGIREVAHEACAEPQRAGRVGRAERGAVELAGALHLGDDGVRVGGQREDRGHAPAARDPGRGQAADVGHPEVKQRRRPAGEDTPDRALGGDQGGPAAGERCIFVDAERRGEHGMRVHGEAERGDSVAG